MNKIYFSNVKVIVATHEYIMGIAVIFNEPIESIDSYQRLRESILEESKNYLIKQGYTQIALTNLNFTINTLNHL